MQARGSKPARKDAPTRAQLQEMWEGATERSREMGDQRDLAMQENTKLREVVAMGVCPDCHTAEGTKALKRTAGYLGEFEVDMDCPHPYHELRKLDATLMAKGAKR